MEMVQIRSVGGVGIDIVFAKVSSVLSSARAGTETGKELHHMNIDDAERLLMEEIKPFVNSHDAIPCPFPFQHAPLIAKSMLT